MENGLAYFPSDIFLVVYGGRHQREGSEAAFELACVEGSGRHQREESGASFELACMEGSALSPAWKKPPI